MANIVFDLSRKEDMQQFISDASGILTTCELLTEEMLCQLKQRATHLDLHALDFHQATLELIFQRGGMGLQITHSSDAGYVQTCRHCCHEMREFLLVCAACGMPLCIAECPADIGLKTFTLAGDNLYQEHIFTAIPAGTRLSDCQEPSFIRCAPYGELSFALCNPLQLPSVVTGGERKYTQLPIYGVAESLLPNHDRQGNSWRIGFSLTAGLIVRLHAKDTTGIETTTELGKCPATVM